MSNPVSYTADTSRIILELFKVRFHDSRNICQEKEIYSKLYTAFSVRELEKLSKILLILQCKFNKTKLELVNNTPLISLFKLNEIKQPFGYIIK